jgi:hypothetical protein
MFSWRPDPGLESPRPAQMNFQSILSNQKMKVILDSENSSKLKTNNTTGETMLKLVKIQKFEKDWFNIDEVRHF